jgi:hypothetical protein
MKTSKRSNGKKVNLNKNPRRGVKFSRLSPNITQWSLYLLGAFFWFPWGDGLNMNHNEMFLADLS